ncbi:hypothetical protein EL26_13950 [Tumebacillus flagellatus]|uniref:Uncharacterized protein n=1 Tax=Tumebacillus flagellatus TaxID=1157490 RepID=A0A074LQB3_9BACL|nr:hypothetical protein EL26_13950 [Tumebacillus flagellatus]
MPEGFGSTVAEIPRVFNANSSCLQNAQGEGRQDVGDAAAACDPLSSQGIHKAIGTAIEASLATRAELRKRLRGQPKLVPGRSCALRAGSFFRD